MNAPQPTRRLASFLTVRHGREILALASPIMLTMLSQTLMWTVDTIFLGHHSSLALGAAGLGGILLWTAYCLVNNLSRITGTFVSQAHGRGDDAAVGDYAWQGLYLATLTGAGMTLLAWNARPLLGWTGVAPDILDATAEYVRWRGLSAAFTQWGFTLMGYFQGRRRVAVPMVAGIVSNLANGLLDWWFIFGFAGVAVAGRTWLEIPAMGLRGAALATSAGVVVNTLVLAVAALASLEDRRRFRIHAPRRPDLGKLRAIVRVGLPSALENFVDMSTFALFSTFVGRIGTAALAANQIQIQLLSFSFMPMWGLATAGSVLVGNHLGAADPDAADRYGRQVYKLGLFYCLGLGLLLALLRERVFAVFTPDPAVLAYGAALALLAAVFQVGDALRMLGSGMLTGAGDTRPVMIITLLVMWGVLLPVAWTVVVARDGGVTQAWTVAAACYLLQGWLLWERFRSGRWRGARIFSAG